MTNKEFSDKADLITGEINAVSMTIEINIAEIDMVVRQVRKEGFTKELVDTFSKYAWNLSDHTAKMEKLGTDLYKLYSLSVPS